MGIAVNLVETEDGSLSCLDCETGELYHNRAGAFTEALKNYVEPSEATRLLRSRGELHILDVCFGLGYNTWVALSRLMNDLTDGQLIRVVALERDALIISAIPQILRDSRLSAVGTALDGAVKIGTNSICLPGLPRARIEIEIRQVDVRAALPGITGDFDLVLHDPFSPKRVPELWSVDLFGHYFRLLRSGKGRVLTYSAASAVRGGLIEAGFEIFRTRAVGGKSGGTLAIVPGADLFCQDVFPLEEKEKLKIGSRAGVPYRDHGLADCRGDILKRRQSEQMHRSSLQTNGVSLS